jgi:hypothetical protein
MKKIKIITICLGCLCLVVTNAYSLDFSILPVNVLNDLNKIDIMNHNLLNFDLQIQLYNEQDMHISKISDELNNKIKAERIFSVSA